MVTNINQTHVDISQKCPAYCKTSNFFVVTNLFPWCYMLCYIYAAILARVQLLGKSNFQNLVRIYASTPNQPADALMQRAVTDEAGGGKEVEKELLVRGSSQCSVEVLSCQSSFVFSKNLLTSSSIWSLTCVQPHQCKSLGLFFQRAQNLLSFMVPEVNVLSLLCNSYY